MARVSILGGGVIGMTTAFYLQLIGHETKVFTDRRPDRIDLDKRESMLASLHCAASILPHSIQADNIDELTKVSQMFFRSLWYSAACGVRQQRHYEIFEHEQSRPIYADVVDGFRGIDPDSAATNTPRRNGIDRVFGWYFNAFFCEGPFYVKKLYQLYEQAGGEIVNGRVTREEFLSQKTSGAADALVNCAGYWSTQLFDDDEGYQYQLIRGHWIKVRPVLDELSVDEVIPLDRKSGELFSYNYHPPKDMYCRRDLGTGDTHSADVYFYPRTDGWVLGGSRQEGKVENGVWVGEDTVGNSLTLENGVSVPEPIFELNREIIQSLTGIDISNQEKFRRFGYIGYRFIRTPDGPGLRLEESPKYPGLVHNYGHGGSGVTPSWGCAVEVGKVLSAWVSTPDYKPRFENANPESQFILEALADIAKSTAI